MGGGIETFVIHLGRAAGRKAGVDALLAGSPYPAHVFPAVDGRAMPPHTIAGYVSEAALFEPRFPFALDPGAVGCFLSHRAVWQAIVDQGLDGALILEDDVALEEGFAEAAALAAQRLQALGYVQFQVRSGFSGPEVARAGRFYIQRPDVVPLRTSAQMVSRDAAERLLAVSDRIDRPVDVFLQMFWETGVRPHVVVPSGVSDQTAARGGSTITHKRGVVEKLWREWARGQYRRAIRRLSVSKR